MPRARSRVADSKSAIFVSTDPGPLLISVITYSTMARQTQPRTITK
jgi:hypothetical protein